MDEEAPQPEKPAVPPPDLPKPSIPPPDLPKPPPLDAESSSKQAAGPVKIAIRQPGDSDNDSDETGAVPFNTRMIAVLIDVLISVGLYIAAVIVLPGFVERAAVLLCLGYMITRDSLPFLGGQSVGKRAMKIKVLTLEDKPITGNWEAAVVRNVLFFLPFVGPLIELFVLLTREGKPDEGRRLGDEWAKTKVVIAACPPAPDEET